MLTLLACRWAMSFCLTRFIEFRTLRLGFCFALLASLLGASGAASAGEADALPFFSKPYPFRYAYTSRPPQPCWEFRDVETFFGPRREKVWVCDDAVTARY